MSRTPNPRSDEVIFSHTGHVLYDMTYRVMTGLAPKYKGRVFMAKQPHTMNEDEGRAVVMEAIELDGRLDRISHA